LGLLPKLASDALAVRKYLSNNSIEPEKEYTKIHQNETTKKFVFTYQCQFKTEEEAKIFLKFNNLINKGLLDI